MNWNLWTDIVNFSYICDSIRLHYILDITNNVRTGQQNAALFFVFLKLCDIGSINECGLQQLEVEADAGYKDAS